MAIITVARCASARMVFCTRASAMAAAAVTRLIRDRISIRCWEKYCASTSIAQPIRFRQPIRLPAASAPVMWSRARRSGPTAFEIRGVSVSIAARATSTLATWGRICGKRSMSKLQPAWAARITAGEFWKPPSVTTRQWVVWHR